MLWWSCFRIIPTVTILLTMIIGAVFFFMIFPIIGVFYVLCKVSESKQLQKEMPYHKWLEKKEVQEALKKYNVIDEQEKMDMYESYLLTETLKGEK